MNFKSECIVLIFIVLVDIKEAFSLTSQFYDKLTFDDVTTTDVANFVFTSHSLVECAGLCAMTPDCTTFTFNQRSRLCQGHGATNIEDVHGDTKIFSEREYTCISWILLYFPFTSGLHIQLAFPWHLL